MDYNILAVLLVGFVIGIKHAFEPDHIIAVSTIASRSKNLWRSSLSGVFWGLGHTLMLFFVGIVLIILKVEFSLKWALSLEFLVGIMLVYLGLTSIITFKRKKIHNHDHNHEGYEHSHFHETRHHEHKQLSRFKSFIIGAVHGLAGSAAVILLTMTMVNTVWGAMVYIMVFGVGTIVGMMLFTTMLGIPFVMSSKKLKFNHVMVRITGLISIVFGFYYMYNLGFNEMLFQLWIE